MVRELAMDHRGASWVAAPFYVVEIVRNYAFTA